jgi:hypothetical protein
MRYFRLHLAGNTDDRSLAFVRDPPSGLGLYDYCMARGKRIGDRYPRDAKVYMDKRSPGIKLGSVLGNTLSYFMVNTAMKDVIISTCKCEIEVLPFTLYNHKRRVHSKDYWILNPIGTFDCLNRQASDIRYMDATQKQVVGVSTMVFDIKKMADAPDLFRVPEDPEEMFMSERLAIALKPLHPTNVIFTEDMQMQPVKV